jgi:glycosyltransferase involved in cell wall biosynthesis
MKNLAFIVPDLSNGGAEKVAANWSIGLSDTKYKKYIIVYNDKQIDYDYKGELITLDIITTNNFFSKLFGFIKRVIKLKKIKKEKDIDVSISFSENTNLANIFSKYKEKVFLTIHGYKSKSLSGIYGLIYKYFIKLFYNNSYKIITVSEGIKNDLINNFNINSDKLDVIYNPFNLEKIKKLKDIPISNDYSNIFNSKSKIIVTMGRLHSTKGQKHLIRAFKLVNKRFPNTKLVILGQGKLKEYLEKLAKKLNIHNKVHFLGFLKNPFNILNQCDIFVLSSLHEGFGNVIVEAMICGLPVISTDCKVGPREILIKDFKDNHFDIDEMELADFGILVPVCNNEDYTRTFSDNEIILSNAIIKLLDDDILYKKYKNLSKERVNKYDIKKIMKKIDALIENSFI